MAVYEVNHPLIQHKLGLLRKADLSTKQFRELASEVARLLTYEATKDLETETITINGWAGPVSVQQIKGKKITVVPILRAGLGMMNGVLDMIPSAKVSVVGLYRNEETLEPVAYYEKLASEMEERTALIIDPMLATGGSLLATIEMLKNRAAGRSRGSSWLPSPRGSGGSAKPTPMSKSTWPPLTNASMSRVIFFQDSAMPGTRSSALNRRTPQ